MIQNTLYAKYILERQNTHVLENDSGFITYRFLDKECFIADMFIDSSKRSIGNGKALVYELEGIAIANSCNVISANIHLWDKGASNTLMAALAVGFDVARAEQNIILITKKISGRI